LDVDRRRFEFKRNSRARARPRATVEVDVESLAQASHTTTRRFARAFVVRRSYFSLVRRRARPWRSLVERRRSTVARERTSIDRD